MKMPEKHDLLAAILAAKEQGIGAILAFAMAYLRGRYNGGAFTKNSNRRNGCAPLSPSSFVTFSDFRRTKYKSRLYNERVYRLSIGTDSIGSLIKRFAAKKAGVEDGRNQ